MKSRGEDVMKLADSSGICKGVIWEKTGFLKYKCSYNVTVCSYNGPSLSVSSNSVITEIEDIGEVNDEGSSVESDNTKEVYGEIIGVIRCESYHSCLVCKAKVVPTGAVMGKCGKCVCVHCCE